MQNDVTISLSQMVWLLGGLTAVYTFLQWALKPLKRIDDHESRIKTLEETADERRQTDSFMMESMNAIINHMIDGNGQSELKKVRDKYQSEIIHRHK